MRLRFTIRDLLWLAVVVALAVGWWLERSRLCDQMDDLNSHAHFLERLRIESQDLREIVHELAQEPGYEKLKLKLRSHDEAWSSR